MKTIPLCIITLALSLAAFAEPVGTGNVRSYTLQELKTAAHGMAEGSVVAVRFNYRSNELTEINKDWLSCSISRYDPNNPSSFATMGALVPKWKLPWFQNLPT